ncbi:MAG TPA: VOC family protein [Acidimicrobiales bacterium]|nr:VOC family protein [Acidimicrobiales bacterium]HLN43430.1 VOC family protein [Acidimicrobiales bacterium]
MPSRIDGAALDHVAVAVERWSDAWPRYAVELGGTWSSGGLNVGFGPSQLRYANGGRVEILQPWRPQDNPFLRRFLDRHGPGPHHLTFKVPDLAAALDLARDAGFTPVGVDLGSPDWKEAFLHPRQATGIVVQLAQAAYAWESPAPEGFPTSRRDPAASLLRVTHALADLGTGLALFEGLLGGRRTAHGDAPDRTWEFADLEWPGPPTLRLVAPHPEVPGTPGADPLRTWLGALPGRLHHLAFAVPGDQHGAGDPGPFDPAGFRPRADVPGLFPTDGATLVVEPQDNLGTRLALVRPEETTGT